MSTTVPPPSKIDFLSAEYTAEPFHLLAQLRADSGVHYLEAHDTWVIAGYQEIKKALMNPAVFGSEGAINHLELTNEPEILDLKRTLGAVPHVNVMTRVDPPVHTRQRALANQAVTMRQTADAWAERIQEVVDSLVDEFEAGSTIDFVESFASPLPTMVILEILGLPVGEWRQFKAWSEAFVAPKYGVLTREAIIECERQLGDFRTRLFCEVRDRRAAPRNDVLTRLIESESEGQEPLNDAEIVSLAIMFLQAGNNTTTHALGTTLLGLLEWDGFDASMLDDDAFLTNVISESLRRVPPVMGVFRITTQDAEINGVTIPRGAHVLIMLAAGNHDASKFERPDALEPGRQFQLQHLSFGYGMHRCIGEPLARIELEVAMRRLFTRFPHLERKTKDLEYEQSLFFRGIKRLDLELKP